MEKETTMTREDVLVRLKRPKEIKAQAVDSLERELADIVEKDTGKRTTNFFIS